MHYGRTQWEVVRIKDHRVLCSISSILLTFLLNLGLAPGISHKLCEFFNVLLAILHIMSTIVVVQEIKLQVLATSY